MQYEFVRMKHLKLTDSSQNPKDLKIECEHPWKNLWGNEIKRQISISQCKHIFSFFIQEV